MSKKRPINGGNTFWVKSTSGKNFTAEFVADNCNHRTKSFCVGVDGGCIFHRRDILHIIAGLQKLINQEV